MRARLPHALALAVALAGVLGSPAFAQEPAATPSATAAPITTRIELVADSLPEDTRAAVEAELARKLAGMAEETDFVVAESEAAGLVLRIEIGQPDHKNPVYVIHSVALYNGEVLERAEARTCFRCTPEELIAYGLELLPSAVSQADAARSEAARQSEPPPPTVDAPDASENLLRAPRPGPPTYVGISLGALGLAGAVLGGAFLERGLVSRPGDPGRLTVLNYKAPGAALLGAGLTAMVAGTILLAIDAWVIAPRRAAKARASSARVGIGAEGLVLEVRI